MTTNAPINDVDLAVRTFAASKPLDLAVLSDQGVMTWAELDAKADALSNAFRRDGVAPGDHVVWLGRNRVEYAVLVVAARRARAVIVSLNWRLSPGELAVIVKDCDPKIVLLEPDLAPLLAGVIPDKADKRLIYLDAIGPGRSYADFAASGAEAMPPLSPTPEDPLFLYYTSGTTGTPKGVVHGRFRSDDAAARHGVHFAWDQSSITLIVAPVFHLTGSVWVQSSLCIGAKQVMSAGTAASLIVSAIQRWGVTHTVLVPTMIRMVLDELKASGTTIDTLKTITYGGAPMPVALLRETMSTLGARFVQGYGLTETNSPVTFLAPDDHVAEGPQAKLLNSVGRDFLDIKIRIVDTDTGAPLKAGEVGEVQINTPWGMLGYRNRPDLTAAAYTADGWFRTGDGGYMNEDRYLFLVDRINDMIISGGENVMPSEVENVLIQHAGVSEAAVFAVKDPKWGESICAAVVIKGQKPTSDELIAFSRDKLAHYKCPRDVVFIDAMPRNATGKILRRELRQRFNKA